MSIHFACPHCDRPIDVEDRLAGLAGHCQHCGQTMTVPAGAPVATEPGLKLRPVEGLDQPGVPTPGTAHPAAPLHVRPLAAAEPAPVAAPSVDERPIQVLDPYHFADKQKRRVPLNPHYETRIARAAARFLRINRDRLYLISLALLVTTLIGVLFHLKPLLHLGMVGVVLANASLMLVDGILYLLVVPFRESLAEGIGATLFPPYHWIRHWDRMRGPFLGTVRSFVPVLLAGLVWVFLRGSAGDLGQGSASRPRRREVARESSRDQRRPLLGPVRASRGSPRKPRTPWEARRGSSKIFPSHDDQSPVRFPLRSVSFRGIHPMTIDQLMTFAVDQRAADLFLQTGTLPRLRVNGLVREIDSPALTDEQVRGFIRAIAPRQVTDDLEGMLARGFDFSYALGDKARFRVNLYSHLGSPGMVIRIIPPQIRTFEELHLPPILADVTKERRGLTLLSGATGSGKSSTLAAMIDFLNTNYHIKILTIEDPVEFVHTSKKSLVSHVEVGADTPSFEQGLRQAVRQAPDVILVGELRDSDTVRQALRAADTGHQVLGTIHASNAAQTVERLFALVPPTELAIAREQLASSLVGVVAQRLARGQGGALVPVVEVLRGDAVTSKFILDDKLGEIADYIATGQKGMQTFDKHILDLHRQGTLTEAEALRVATNRDAVAFGMRIADHQQA